MLPGSTLAARTSGSEGPLDAASRARLLIPHPVPTMSSTPLLRDNGAAHAVPEFQDGVWRRGAHEAAEAGRHKTRLLAAFLSIFVKPRLPGGSVSCQMSVRVAAPPLQDGSVGAWRIPYAVDKLTTTFGPGIATMGDVFDKARNQFGTNPCMGWRDITSARVDDKGVEKYSFSEPRWLTYIEAHDLATAFGAGLSALGLSQHANINFFSNTSRHWQLAAQGCFQRGFVVCTTYANLGVEALAFGIQQAGCEFVFTDAQLVDVVAQVLSDCPRVKHIIVVPDARPRTSRLHIGLDAIRSKLASSLRTTPPLVHSFDDVVKLGQAQPSPRPPVAPADVAVIMYTSGSTGTPKGVVLEHRNMCAALGGVCRSIPNMHVGDVFLAMLPLAHILEMLAECGTMATGSAIAYGTTKTVTDNSPCVDSDAGAQGDATAMRPTLMALVPLVLEKIRSAILAKVDATGGIKAKLFHYALRVKTHYFKMGRDVPWCNRLVFDPLRTRLLGGRVRYILSGGGALSEDTQLFHNLVFNCPVGQGLGMTETCGIACTVWPNDRRMGRTGAPISCCELRLRDWPEGGYFASAERDPTGLPRGELLVGGPHVCRGYYQMAKETDESFFTDERGVRFFITVRCWCCVRVLGCRHDTRNKAQSSST